MAFMKTSISFLALLATIFVLISTPTAQPPLDQAQAPASAPLNVSPFAPSLPTKNSARS
ncbi:UNVERIFIED_CONTAM: hypothetical protein Slati_3163200 [Sesamum latifolium]|uniref:Uncharacterized protein n=1 Tax=Sesamum latifolium TaxID=2727402 RepID=A0AAW2UWS6_9LAMI